MAEVKLNEIPEGIRTLHTKGLEALERGNLDYAMDLFESALKQEPRFLEARRQLRKAAFRCSTGRLSGLKQTAALIKLSALLKTNPSLALETAETLLRQDPLNLKISKICCDAARACNMPEIALMSLELLNTNRPDQLNILEPLADLSRDAELYDQEYECRNRIAEIKPGDSQALKNLKDSAARLTMGKAGWQEAESFRDVTKNEPVRKTSELQAAQDKVKADPENREPRLALANLYVRSKSYDSAIQTLTDGFDSQSTIAPELKQKIRQIEEMQLHDKLATAEDLGDEETVSVLRHNLSDLRLQNALEQVQQYPTDLQLKYDYGKILFENGDLTNAIQQFQQARENPQRRARANLYIARAFSMKEQLDLAAEHFEHALRDIPSMNHDRKEVLYEFGLLHEKCGDRAEASQCFREIYTADIGYRDVAERVENR